MRARVKDLCVAQRHFVEIARALSQDARVVIMDEPTAALSQREIHELYRIIAQLRAAGTAVIFISHKFDEIFDRRRPLHGAARRPVRGRRRPGRHHRAGTGRPDGRPRRAPDLSRRPDVAHRRAAAGSEELCHPTEFDDVSFTLRQGEILGFYGLVGAGRSEVMQALFGLTRRVAGTVKPGRPSDRHQLPGRRDRPRHRLRAGRPPAPGRPPDAADPAQHHPADPVAASASSCAAGARQETTIARHFSEQLELKRSYLTQNVSELSGGNQQKVVLGKWLATNPKVIILDEPTKGIDIGSKAAVHRFISELVRRGLSVILVSSELPEVLGLADRIVVMHQGRISARLRARRGHAGERGRRRIGQRPGKRRWRA